MAIIGTILLWLLKLIGILLLVVLGFLLLLLLLVLCVPVCYEADFEKEQELAWGGKISWLFRLIRVRFQYTPTKEITEFWLGCFPISKSEEEKSPEEKPKGAEEDLWQANWQDMEEEEFKRKLFAYLSDAGGERAEIPESKPGEMQEIEETPELYGTPISQKTEKTSETKEIDQTAKSAESTETPELCGTPMVQRAEETVEIPELYGTPVAQTVFGQENQTEAKNPSDSSRSADDTDMWAEFEDTENSSKTESDKKKMAQNRQAKPQESKKWALVENAWWIFQKVRAYFQKNRGVIRHVLHWPWKMLRSVLPRRADGQITFGLGDPANTGYVLSLFYLFYPGKRGKIEVVPDFEQKIFAGQVAIKGRILLIEIVYYALRLVIDIRILRLLFLIKTLKAGKAAEDEKMRKKKSKKKNQDRKENIWSVSAESEQ